MEGLKIPKQKTHKKKKVAKKSTNNSKGTNMKGRVGNALRSLQRNLDRGHNKEIGPQRSASINQVKSHDDSIIVEADPPPAVVVVMGPAGVGKSTLIRSLVKLYTRQNITTTTGSLIFAVLLFLF